MAGEIKKKFSRLVFYHIVTIIKTLAHVAKLM